jgi:predicted aspartyl protease
MMTGSFTSEGEPALSVQVAGPTGTLEIDAVVDTGFNGELTLPREQIEVLSLPEATVTEVTSRMVVFERFRCTMPKPSSPDSRVRSFITEVPTTPLVGTGLLRSFSLYVEFQADGTVEVAPLPDDSD